MGYYVYVEGAQVAGPDANRDLSQAIAKRYGLDAQGLCSRLDAGRFCVKSDVELNVAQSFAKDLASLGARCNILDRDGKPPEPTPAVARRGQILVLCSAGLHSAWQNEDSVPRKAILISWVAAGLTCGLPKNQRDAVLEFLPRLQRELRPERAHIVPDNFDWLFESDYEPQWPETFLPSHSV